MIAMSCKLMRVRVAKGLLQEAHLEIQTLVNVLSSIKSEMSMMEQLLSNYSVKDVKRILRSLSRIAKVIQMEISKIRAQFEQLSNEQTLPIQKPTLQHQDGFIQEEEMEPHTPPVNWDDVPLTQSELDGPDWLNEV